MAACCGNEQLVVRVTRSKHRQCGRMGSDVDVMPFCAQTSTSPTTNLKNTLPTTVIVEGVGHGESVGCIRHWYPQVKWAE